MRHIGVLAVLLAGFTAVSSALPQNRFVSRREIVPVFAIVTGRDGRRVPELTREHFEVRDDGHMTEIVSFANQPQPLTVGLVIDSSASMTDQAQAVQEGATLAIDALRPEDRMAVVPLMTRPVFERDRARLVAAARAIHPAGASPVWDSIRVNVGSLRREPEPRLLVVFTDGADSVYRRPLDVRTGYYAPNVIADEIRKTGVPMIVVGTPKLDEWFEQAARRAGATILKPKTNQDLRATFPDLIDEAHSAYLLGIQAAEDGREHRLDVRVSVRGAKVKARPFYVAQSR